jgi:hypothetical protein
MIVNPDSPEFHSALVSLPQLDYLSAATKTGKLVDPRDRVTTGIDPPGSRTPPLSESTLRALLHDFMTVPVQCPVFIPTTLPVLTGAPRFHDRPRPPGLGVA